jgi:hypothetical protein
MSRAEAFTLAERLQAVLDDDARPLSWFPAKWAAEALQADLQLPRELRARLIVRLSGQKTGPWHRLYKHLVAVS